MLPFTCFRKCCVCLLVSFSCLLLVVLLFGFGFANLL